MSSLELKLKEIKIRCDSATDGPWSLSDLEPVELWTPKGYGQLKNINYKDCEMIAHARTDIPWLVEQLEKAEKDKRVMAGFISTQEGYTHLHPEEVLERMEKHAEKYK